MSTNQVIVKILENTLRVKGLIRKIEIKFIDAQKNWQNFSLLPSLQKARSQSFGNKIEAP